MIKNYNENDIYLEQFHFRYKTCISVYENLISFHRNTLFLVIFILKSAKSLPSTKKQERLRVSLTKTFLNKNSVVFAEKQISNKIMVNSTENFMYLKKSTILPIFGKSVYFR